MVIDPELNYVVENNRVTSYGFGSPTTAAGPTQPSNLPTTSPDVGYTDNPAYRRNSRSTSRSNSPVRNSYARKSPEMPSYRPDYPGRKSKSPERNSELRMKYTVDSGVGGRQTVTTSRPRATDLGVLSGV